MDIAWDRSGNITSTTDNVWPSRNVSYTIDGLSRVTRAFESDGVSASRDEQWTLTQTGNWDHRKLDLNGDADFTDTDELDDTGAFNTANEWQTRSRSVGIVFATPRMFRPEACRRLVAAKIRLAEFARRRIGVEPSASRRRRCTE